jgi:hypothetical protein
MIDPVHSEKALAQGLAAFPKFAAMKPRIEEVKLFRGSSLTVKFDQDQRREGDPDNFAFEKVVLKTYRSLAGG